MSFAISFFCLGLICFTTGSTLAQHTPENEKNPLAGKPSAISAGRGLYSQTCQSCHGGEGRGDRAPALSTGTFRRGSKDGEIFLNIRNGISGTAMPPFRRLSSPQIWQLVSYIRSLVGPGLKTDRATAGSAAAGEKIFFGAAACSSCHEVNGRGGNVGPEPSTAAKSSAQDLRQKILDPNGSSPGGRRRGPPRVVVVKTKDGGELRGVWRNEDTYSLMLVDAAGKLHMLDKQNIAEQ